MTGGDNSEIMGGSGLLSLHILKMCRVRVCGPSTSGSQTYMLVASCLKLVSSLQQGTKISGT